MHFSSEIYLSRHAVLLMLYLNYINRKRLRQKCTYPLHTYSNITVLNVLSRKPAHVTANILWYVFLLHFWYLPCYTCVTVCYSLMTVFDEKVLFLEKVFYKKIKSDFRNQTCLYANTTIPLVFFERVDFYM